MGNKASSPNGKGPAVSQEVSGIIHEGPPPGLAHQNTSPPHDPRNSLPRDTRDSPPPVTRNSRSRDRQSYDPGPVSLDPMALESRSADPAARRFSANFSMRVRDSGQIGGKHVAEKSVRFVLTGVYNKISCISCEHF